RSIGSHHPLRFWLVDPPPALVGTQQVGFNEFMDDPPSGIVRRGLLWIGNDEGVYEYFGLKLATKYLGAKGIHLTNTEDGGCCLIGEHPIPLPMDPNEGGYVGAEPGGYQYLMTYPAAPLEFNRIMLAALLKGDFDKEMIKGKIIIIGNRAEATPDFFYTPVDTWRMAGAAIHAYNTSQIMRWAEGESMPPRSWSEHWEIAWIWFWTIMGALACLWARAVWRFVLLTIGGLVMLAGVFDALFMAGWWVLFAAPALGWIISTALTIAYLSYRERSQRGALMNIFSRYVSKDVAQVIWDSRDQYLSNGRLRSQRLTATVLFTDLQNFTTISEGMEPQELMAWLNEYMEAMVHVVEEHHGQINKFIGDAIMAIFGVPLPSETEEEIAQDARNAVDCAVAMGEELERQLEKWAERGLPQVKMRVGVFTGPLVAGSLGGIERQEYTVIGDTVNTAARLESFDKTLGMESCCRVLIGDSTLHYLNDEYHTRPIGEVELKGKSELVTIHLVEGRKHPVADPDNPHSTVEKTQACDEPEETQRRMSAI
ncbi:MAG: adenylate/guanylate cyclase domain-containing protein, partial [Pseudomonadota bacterium]